MTKEKSLKQSNNGINFWVGAGLLAVLLSVQLGRDIDRPFYGLHSWGQASGAWMTRTHVKYGLGYTKALNTWAVGDPPTENPKRYLDHPQLGHLLAAVFMLVFGIHEWTIRLINIVSQDSKGPCRPKNSPFSRIFLRLVSPYRLLLARGLECSILFSGVLFLPRHHRRSIGWPSTKVVP
ncbi:MAG: hypothetical protein ACYSW6_02890 [Planctomycetota bacterium]|jgi:hypothetical protein